jgi:hypothetical protein
VLHGLKAMQARFAVLGKGPLRRREIQALNALPGPGGRDAVECVTRALSDGRYRVDHSLGGTDTLTAPPGPFRWRFTVAAHSVMVTTRHGHVLPEFVDLG